MLTKYLVVTVDVNDADYVTIHRKISEDELATLTPLFQAIKEFKPIGKDRNNFPYNEYLRDGCKSVEQLYEHIPEPTLALFYNFLPNSEEGCHTIESIEVMEVTNKTTIL